jgi:hypothetical protein
MEADEVGTHILTGFYGTVMVLVLRLASQKLIVLISRTWVNTRTIQIRMLRI